MEGFNNSSSFSPLDSSKVEPYEVFVFLVVLLLTVAFNAFVILLILRKRTLRTATNLILASLAFSDLLMGAFGIPLVFTCNVIDEFDDVCTVSAIFINFISFSTVAHILFHTCDRFIYMKYALRYQQLMRVRRVYKLLALTWVTTLLASTIRLVWIIGVDLEDEEALYAMQDKETHYTIFAFVCFFCLPLIVIATVDYRMMWLVHRHGILISLRNLPSNLRKQSVVHLLARKRKAVITCILILAVYVVCWFPYFVLTWLTRMADEGEMQIEFWEFWLIYYVRFFSSVFNPWLYTLRKKDLKKAAFSWIVRRR